jgi:hypothetical protein
MQQVDVHTNLRTWTAEMYKAEGCANLDMYEASTKVKYEYVADCCALIKRMICY